jgi:hypothetical protein
MLRKGPKESLSSNIVILLLLLIIITGLSTHQPVEHCHIFLPVPIKDLDLQSLILLSFSVFIEVRGCCSGLVIGGIVDYCFLIIMRINNHLITQPNMQVTWIMMNTWLIDLLFFNNNGRTTDDGRSVVTIAHPGELKMSVWCMENARLLALIDWLIYCFLIIMSSISARFLSRTSLHTIFL